MSAILGGFLYMVGGILAILLVILLGLACVFGSLWLVFRWLATEDHRDL